MANRNLPDQFITMLHDMGLDSLVDALSDGEPCVSVRLNPSKRMTEAELPATCDGQVPWYAAGRYLSERPRFTFDPLLHQGAYYVQEASSMFHSHVVRQLCADADEPLRVLDSCAAPGGKTTAVIDVLPKGSLMVANEYVPSRAAVLRENIIKWSSPYTIVTRGDTEAFRRLKNSFDIILADVPCSGEGMMRKDPEAVSQWSEGLIRECAARQWEIVSNLWPALRPGGCLIYSTCTFNRCENEEMVGRIIDELGGESVSIDTDPQWGIAPGIGTPHHCYRFMPGRLRGEGLFVAVVRKPADEGDKRKPSSRPPKNKPSKASPVVTQASKWLAADWQPQMDVYADGERINAFPKTHADLLRSIRKELDVIHEGVVMATVKGRDLIPTQSLALSPVLSPEAFHRHDISRDEALAYLSGEALSLTDDCPKGFVLLTYLSRPLGFVKNLGRRSNNLYPAPWRIKSKL